MNFTRKFFLAVLTSLIISGGLYAQQVKKKPAAAQKPKPAATAAASLTATGLLSMEPDVLTGKLPNGLTFYIRRNTEPKNRAVLYLVTKAGSVLEEDNQQGL